MHIHIDPVGGIAGDMFVAAMLDLNPQLEAGMIENLRCVQALNDVVVKMAPYDDGVLVGKRLEVTATRPGHNHTCYTELVDSITSSTMMPSVKDRAGEILEWLAQAEAKVHGVELNRVSLHEAGSLDSLADIVCSAFLISAAKVSSWSCGALPCGNGTVATAHGQLPLPAPAVVNLLEGCPVYNDGREGERVTPTGAAILRSLGPKFDRHRQAMKLSGVGHGFGYARFHGISNVLRLTAFDEILEFGYDEKVGVISFEVDDQTPEDLSSGLENLRDHHGVLDVVQIPAIGKKGRLTVHIQVLTQSECVNEIATQCALETATLGVRTQIVDRLVLDRTMRTHRHLGGESLLVKVATRPDGKQTAKVEADQLATAGDFSDRKMLKQTAELDVERKSQKKRD